MKGSGREGDGNTRGGDDNTVTQPGTKLGVERLGTQPLP